MTFRVLVDPAFRRIDEIFSTADLERLSRLAEIVWCRDEAMPFDDFVDAVGSVDAVVFGRWRHGPVGLEAALGSGRLKALLEVAGGHEHDLDYVRCLAAGVAMGSAAPAFAEVVAEMGLALALASVRGVVAADRAMAERSESWLHDGNLDNTTLLGATVGFVGCGGISRSLQRLLEPFAVSILGYDPPLPVEAMADRGIEPVDLATMFDRAGVVFVMAAPTADNHELIDRRLLDRLGRRQSLVVISRGHLVDYEALTEFAAAGRFKAGLDVYPSEPLSASSVLRDLPNVITVPHIAGALPAALLDIGRRVVDDLEALAAGRQPTAMQYLTLANLAGLQQRPER